jgi:alginate O-acetyltransferase complex protein AlgJ
MLAGAWQIIAAATGPAGLEFPRSWQDFSQGRSTGALEKQLDQKLPARPGLITAANSVRYLLTGSGGEQVRTGQDGWLFLTEELRYDANGYAHLSARADLLGTAARSLERQGVKLVVALVPDKARVYSSKLASGLYPDYNSSRYLDALNALRKQGATTVNLLKPLMQAAAHAEVYYRTDTHWNQTGAKIAAEAVASTVQQLGLELKGTTFSSKTNAAVKRPGDLIRLMGLGDTSEALGLLPDVEAPVVTMQNSVDSVGLFGDSAVPVVLTGTSYSMRGNFHGFLQQTLSTRVLNAAKDGGGFLQATRNYLEDDAFRLAKPQVLIWEVPERFLQRKLDDETKSFQNQAFR